jgi:N-methylhydantoinase A
MLQGPELSPERLSEERATLLVEAVAALSESPSRIRVRHELRYRGQSFELAVEEEIDPQPGPGRRSGLSPDGLRAAFARAHEQRYGYSDQHAQVELVNIRVSCWGAAPTVQPQAVEAPPAVADIRNIVFAGEPVLSAVYQGDLAPGTVASGPGMCALPDTTLLIPPGWDGEVDAHGTIHLRRAPEES